MEQVRSDYCVVGAGFAGLAATRRLQDRGQSVTLLEARDRAGGRSWKALAKGVMVTTIAKGWPARAGLS